MPRNHIDLVEASENPTDKPLENQMAQEHVYISTSARMATSSFATSDRRDVKPDPVKWLA